MTVAPSLFDQPLSRTDDPDTSRLAGESVKASRAELVAHIRAAIGRYGPLTQEQIADAVTASQPGRWHPPTVVSACASAGLFEWCRVRNGRGRQVIVWALEPKEQR